MKFLDANVFLYARLDDGPRGDAARGVLRTLDGGVAAATTVVALNEVFWNLRKPLGRPAALDASRKLILMPRLRILPTGDREWNRALHLMATHPHLRPNDALHAAASLEAGIETIVSTDDDFDDLPGLRRQDLG